MTDPSSPPKRVTRARAAAKTDDTAVKTTKVATAASKAKATRSTATRTTATTKRKTRADDEHNDEPEDIIEPEEAHAPAPAKTRGRPKRAAAAKAEPEPEPEQSREVEEEAPAPAPAKTTRGRAKKATANKQEPEPEPEQTIEVEETPAPAPAKATRGRAKKVDTETPAPEPTPAPAPTKTTRGRAKKIDVPEEESAVMDEPPKRTTRTRAATITKATAPKTVKFEELDKENIAPLAAKGKPKAAEVGTGLKAKPVRKPAAPATRATRGRAKVEDKKQGSSPLSPKKVTQVGATRDHDSDDELATNEKTPMKPLMKSPVKPPGSIFNTAKKLYFSNSTSITVNRVTTQDLSGSIMASPARRPQQSPFKESIKTSPQRPGFGGSMFQSPFKPTLQAPKAVPQNNSLKASFLQSPARRPPSPTKVTESGSPTRSDKNKSMFGATPKANTFKISRFTTPRTLNKSMMRPGPVVPPSAPPKFSTGSPKSSKHTDDSTLMREPTLKFYGRLSSIMPREADQAFSASEAIAEETEQRADEPEPEKSGDQMEVDEAEIITVEESIDAESTTPPASPPRNSTGAFELREQDDHPFQDSDSEDELASSSPKYSPTPLSGFNASSHDFASSPATPTPFQAISKTPRTSSTQRFSEKKQTIGFTPLARQLSDWMAASPEKYDGVAEPASPTAGSLDNANADTIATIQESPAKSTLFEDEMFIRDELAAVPVLPTPQLEMDEPEFDMVELDEEDLALAYEADEMSLLEPELFAANEESEDIFNTEGHEQIQNAEVGGVQQSFGAEGIQNNEETLDIDAEIVDHFEEPVEENEPAPSEASQEYGDENAMLIDPALLAMVAPQSPTTPSYSTPKRVLTERTFHTVSKVPLKAAAEDSTPVRPSPMKRSASVSRLPVQRPTGGLTRNNTVISYSPQKRTAKARPQQPQDIEMQGTYSSPSKSNTEMWSTVGTPARTPRRDLNTALLKGAVVFVDVHTTEGADASVLFTELLTQMGARCVRTWNWNSNGEDGSKIGITHVVFKDGGKRTLERARETNGVVFCVGVGWVLE
jgi:hypothetical protein